MIRLTNDLPELCEDTVEYIKIKCIYDCYKDVADFWVQDTNSAIISMLDGNMVIKNIDANIEELKEFISVISPGSVFTDYKTAESLGLFPLEEAIVFAYRGEYGERKETDKLSSREIYDLLNVKGLSLPDYEYFATDFCRRLNYGKLDYYAKKNRFAVILFLADNAGLINGLASHEKGGGTEALRGITANNRERKIFACCTPKNKEFYLKNNFELLYKVAYWMGEK